VATVRNPLRETRLYTPYYIVAFVTCHTTEYCSHRRTKWSDLYRVTHYATLFECPPKADIPSKRVNVSSWLLLYKQRSACPTVHYVIREMKQLYRTVLLAGFCLEPCPNFELRRVFCDFLQGASTVAILLYRAPTFVNNALSVLQTVARFLCESWRFFIGDVWRTYSIQYRHSPNRGIFFDIDIQRTTIRSLFAAAPL